MKRVVYVTILAFLSSGCLHQIALNSIGGMMDTGFAVLNEEQDLDIAEKSIPSNLKLLETIIREDPGNEHYLLIASQGYASYSLGFVEDDSIQRAKILFLRSKRYGLQILDRNRSFASAVNGSVDEFRASLETFSKDDVPAIFWTAIGWGSYIERSLDDPSALADIPKVEAMMQYVLKKDSLYFYGGAHFVLGTLYGSRSKILGGNPEASQQHFERCLAINKGKFLMTYIYYARSYAVQTQNKELFEHCLTVVDTTSIDVSPGARLSNSIAKKKARRLREKMEQLF